MTFRTRGVFAIVLTIAVASCAIDDDPVDTATLESNELSTQQEILDHLRGPKGRDVAIDVEGNLKDADGQVQADLRASLAPPNNVRRTTDPRECSDHLPPAVAVFGGSLACAAALADNETVLVWDWQLTIPPPGFYTARPEGYRIYVSVEDGPMQLWDTQGNGEEWTTRGFDPPVTGKRACYVVTAYDGALESDPSSPVCTDGKELNLQHTTLWSDASKSYRHFDRDDGGRFIEEPDQDWSGDRLFVGFRNPIEPDYWTFSEFRSAVHFDLSAIAHRVVWKATLLYTVKPIDLHNPSDCELQADCFPVDGQCIYEVDFAHQDWQSGLSDNTVPEIWDAISTSPPSGNGAHAVDVTPSVRQWAQWRPNLGLVFKGYRDASPGFDTETISCVQQVNQVQLQVTYF